MNENHEIRAIETYYKGYRFRSRLEARWAVFLDAVGAEWEYEPEGFVLPDGRCYLPDFRVHNVMCRGRYEKETSVDVWLEVKGKMTKEDSRLLADFSQKASSTFHDIDDNAGHAWPWVPNPCFCVGAIPVGRTVWDLSNSAFDPIQQEDDICWVLFNFSILDGDSFPGLPVANASGGLRIVGWDGYNGLDCDGKDDEYSTDFEKTVRAYDLARQARFEHGERPSVSV